MHPSVAITAPFSLARSAGSGAKWLRRTPHPGGKAAPSGQAGAPHAATQRLTSQAVSAPGAAVLGAAHRLPGPPSGSSPGRGPRPGWPHAVHGVGEHAGHRVEVRRARPLHAERELPGLLPGGRSQRP